MASVLIGLGVIFSPAHVLALEREARRLPEDWSVAAVGSVSTGIFDVRIKAPHGDASCTFAPGGGDGAVAFLKAMADGKIGLVPRKKE